MSRATKRFGTSTAVDRVDLDVASGERVAIFGANGSGKSTLLKMIVGLLRPSAGTVSIEGSPPLTFRRRIGFLGHSSHLYPSLTAEENLRFFAKLYSADERTSIWLEDVGLSHKRNDLAGSMSRGEVQRLALARCLLHDPDLLLLDEPFTGLDEEGADEIMMLAPRPGRTIVVVTHDIERGKTMTDRFVTMSRGNLA